MSHVRELLLRLRYQWHLPSLLAIAIMVLLVAWMSRDPLDLEQASGQTVEARITRLTSLGSRYQGRWPGLRISAETDAGIRGTTTVLPPDIRGCELGDSIEAQQVGMKLYLKPRPCE